MHLGKMPILAKSPNTDLSRGFTVAQVAEKHGWPESLVWYIALEGKDDLLRFKVLMWGLLTWDHWYWTGFAGRSLEGFSREKAPLPLEKQSFFLGDNKYATAQPRI